MESAPKRTATKNMITVLISTSPRYWPIFQFKLNDLIVSILKKLNSNKYVFAALFLDNFSGM